VIPHEPPAKPQRTAVAQSSATAEELYGCVDWFLYPSAAYKSERQAK
jgi:hypothetical protein